MPETPLAIVALTREAARLGARLRDELGGCSLYVAERYVAEGGTTVIPFSAPTASLIEGLWTSAAGLVLVMASGVAVRLVAPLLGDKWTDPPVVVVDERGRHAIALLGGHGGGANRLAQRVAAAVGAAPVVTTASDLGGAPRVDLLGEQYGWHLEHAPPAVVAAAVDGRELGIYQDSGERAWAPASVQLRTFESLQELAESGLHAIVITDRALPDGAPIERWVLWRPRTLVAGIGCASGATEAEIRAVVHDALGAGALAAASLRALATIDRKRDEPGLVAFARAEDLPILTYEAAALDTVEDLPSPSAVVREHVGTRGVSEPAALLASGASELLVAKVKHPRATAAVARVVPAVLEAAAQARGTLSVIGLGPDGRDHLTQRARERLLAADVVVGYRPYVEQVRAWLPATEAESSAIGQERERAARALDLALAGRRVAVVSSGDAGIYGMAGLVFEELAARGLAESHAALVEVVPGVTAASAAAAVLGAPLMADFAVLSLSDLQIPWSEIEARLSLLAGSDLTLALYNPSSRSRGGHFHRAVQVLLERRAPETLVALVRNALRPDQEVHLTTLGTLPEDRVDMWTLVLVTSSRTRQLGPFLVAPRSTQRETPNGAAFAAPFPESITPSA